MRIDRSSLSSLFFPSNEQISGFRGWKKKNKKKRKKEEGDAAEGWELRWKGARLPEKLPECFLLTKNRQITVHVSLATILEEIRKGTYRALLPTRDKGPTGGGGDPHGHPSFCASTWNSGGGTSTKWKYLSKEERFLSSRFVILILVREPI